MNTLQALDVASAILAVLQFSAGLPSTLNQHQAQLSVGRNEEQLQDAFDKLADLRAKLCAVHSYGEKLALAEAFKQSKDASKDPLSLQEHNLSCIEDSGKLLDDIEHLLARSSGGEMVQLSMDSKAELRSAFEKIFPKEKVERLCRVVTKHVRNIVKYAAPITKVARLRYANI